MIIKSIELADYRNYDSLVLQFDRGTNILYGDNAQGKTNILEAIYVAATTKSHKGSKDREIVNFDKEEAHIRTYLEKDGKRNPCGYASEKVQIQRNCHRWPEDQESSGSSGAL